MGGKKNKSKKEDGKGEGTPTAGQSKTGKGEEKESKKDMNEDSDQGAKEVNNQDDQAILDASQQANQPANDTQSSDGQVAADQNKQADEPLEAADTNINDTNEKQADRLADGSEKQDTLELQANVNQDQQNLMSRASDMSGNQVDQLAADAEKHPSQATDANVEQVNLMTPQTNNQGEGAIAELISKDKPVVEDIKTEEEPVINQTVAAEAKTQVEPMAEHPAAAEIRDQEEPVGQKIETQAEPMAEEPIVSQVKTQEQPVVTEAKTQAEPMAEEPIGAQVKTQDGPVAKELETQEQPVIAEVKTQGDQEIQASGTSIDDDKHRQSNIASITDKALDEPTIVETDKRSNQAAEEADAGLKHDVQDIIDQLVEEANTGVDTATVPVDKQADQAAGELDNVSGQPQVIADANTPAAIQPPTTSNDQPNEAAQNTDEQLGTRKVATPNVDTQRLELPAAADNQDVGADSNDITSLRVDKYANLT